MPTYEYQCPDCEHLFELFQNFSEKPAKKCPVCGKRRVARIVSGGAGILFKGSGFYETDYRRGEGSDYKKKSDSESGSSKDKDSKGEGDKSKSAEGVKAEKPKTAPADTAATGKKSKPAASGKDKG